ncbi:MAG: sulfotransferase family protein [Proteobacteria bacterium]|nr:sulfotransferase family protein [Pseudomonadota bacterium]
MTTRKPGRILALWAVPRSTSTAFEWMMRERGDFLCLHEPFNEVYYYGQDRRTDRDAHIPPRPGLAFPSVWAEIQAQAAAGPVFLKDFAYSIEHMADDAFLDRFDHGFLIRDPAKVLPSIHHRWPDFTLEEAGFEALSRLFDRVRARIGTVPPVIDSDDLLARPAETVEAFCAAVGIPFLPQALNWQPKEEAKASWYDGGSWHDNLRRSTGIQAQPRSYAALDDDPRLRHAHDLCRPIYEALYAHRLTGGVLA